jgi:hypothetical protein
MANFEKLGQNIHGTTQSVSAGAVFTFGLWGPWYKSDPNSDNWDLELVVSISDSGAETTLAKGAVTSDPPVRAYSVAGLSVGAHTFFAKDRFGAIYTTFVLDVKATSGRKRLTAAQLTNKDGLMGWTGWTGASAPVQALAQQLETASGGSLSKAGTLQGAGHISTIDEHYSGLSLDIMLNSADETQKRQAHNLIRFLVRNRVRVGYRQMFYQNWGFGQSGPIGSSAGHNNHIHIDWFDASLAEPAGFANRSQWTAISWPDVAMSSGFLSSEAALNGLRTAWNSTEAPFDSITDLFQ